MAFSGNYALATITNPGGALTNFPIRVDLSDMPAGWWSLVDTSTGAKGRAAKDDGTTELATDWIDFDDTGETGVVRVLWSGTLAASGTQKIRIYPPLAANSTYGATDTYGSDNAYPSSFEGYWPLSDDINDRTANGLDMSVNGTPPGLITDGPEGGGAYRFDGTSGEYLNYAGAPVADNPGTLMAASRVPTGASVSAAAASLTLTDESDLGGTTINFQSDLTVEAYNRDGPGSGQGALTSTSGTTNVWHHQAGRFISDSNRIAYLDGGSAGSATGTEGWDPNLDQIWIGRVNDLYEEFDVAEVILASGDLGADWGAHEALQVTDQASMFSGGWTLITVGGGLSIPIAMHHYKQMRGEAP